MDRGQAVVVVEMQHDNMENEWRVRCLDLVLGSEVDRDPVFPVLEFLVELSDGIEQLAVRLFGGLGGVKPVVHFALHDGQLAHDPE